MSQLQQVARFMIRAGSISQREALLDLHVQSLTSVISKLRNIPGMKIRTEYKEHPVTRQKYARYHLLSKDRAAQVFKLWPF